jgi:micrococcal nuclease
MKSLIGIRLSIFIIFLVIPLISYCQLQGRVVSIADGDTFTMLVNNAQVRIRLHGIDCPERGQDFSNVAKEFLSDYVYNRVVAVEELDIDRYGRTIGMVEVEGVNVNEALLKAGLAWHVTPQTIRAWINKGG